MAFVMVVRVFGEFVKKLSLDLYIPKEATPSNSIDVPFKFVGLYDLERKYELFEKYHHKCHKGKKW